MNIDFEIGTKVFHIVYGWGRVTYQYTIQWEHPNVKDSDLVCQVRFKSGEDVHFTKQMVKLLSTKEHTLNGQSLVPEIDYNKFIGQWGLFWDDDGYKESFVLAKLGNYIEDADEPFEIEEGTSYEEFRTIPIEAVNLMKLDERGYRSSN